MVECVVMRDLHGQPRQLPAGLRRSQFVDRNL
jgi:hypothetical protein